MHVDVATQKKTSSLALDLDLDPPPHTHAFKRERASNACRDLLIKKVRRYAMRLYTLKAHIFITCVTHAKLAKRRRRGSVRSVRLFARVRVCLSACLPACLSFCMYVYLCYEHACVYQRARARARERDECSHAYLLELK